MWRYIFTTLIAKTSGDFILSITEEIAKRQPQKSELFFHIHNLFLNNKPSVLSVKITEYEAKFGRQIAEVYTLDDPNVSINDKLLENGLVYKYNGGTKLTFYEQISTLKGEEYVINLINSSNIMTHKDYIN